MAAYPSLVKVVKGLRKLSDKAPSPAFLLSTDLRLNVSLF